jgi:SnoaL-like domain
MELALAYFGDWMERYFTAWKTNDLELLDGLFAEDAVYYYGPFKPPNSGKKRIIDGWLSSPPPQDFKHSCNPIAVHDETGAGHWNVTYRSSSKPDIMLEVDGILVIRFDAQGQCTEHREWFVIREIP